VLIFPAGNSLPGTLNSSLSLITTLIISSLRERKFFHEEVRPSSFGQLESLREFSSDIKIKFFFMPLSEWCGDKNNGR
jgi:hypothetical protein